jgi:aspartate/methionine/tyrosine aminotransferase
MNDDTAMVMLTEPHNPSGVFSPREDVLELADIARRRGAILLINEVYRGFTERSSYHGAADNIVIVSSLSKLFGTYWMRLGWLSAPEAIATRLRHGHTNMGMPTAPAAGLGISVMERAAALQESARDTSRKGFPTVNAWVERTDGVSWHAPQGIGFGCIKIPDGTDDVALAEHLFEKRQVLLVPGTKFEVPGTLRISWLQSGDRLEEGLQRLGEGLKQASGE